MPEHRTASQPKRLVAVFGTRPEAIKLAPVIQSLRGRPRIDLRLLCTTQQADLLPAFLDGFALAPDYQLNSMVPGQSVEELLSRLIKDIAAVLAREQPAAVIVQGDTSSCLAGALAAAMRGIEVVHVEAGLRTGCPDNPFPEELNRRLVAQVTSLHCAATSGNRDALLREGHDPATIVVTGNPVVDAVTSLPGDNPPTAVLKRLLSRACGRRILLLTAHRRESFGSYMESSMAILREFVDAHEDICLLFPVHPNPAVGDAARRLLQGHERIWLLEPLGYEDFIQLCRSAWLIVSDSGGLQEEAATLGKPLLILRAVTERPEAVACGIARLVGPDPQRLRWELERAQTDPGPARQVENPFGDGHSGERIAEAICRLLTVDAR